jgi:HlyD family secretion protein
VRVTIDFVDPPELWSRLGHDYRVIVHVTTWSADSVLTVPIGALFRKGDDWAVFVVRDGRAHFAPVAIGQRNNRIAEVASGLAAGAQVVDRINEGTRVVAREAQ